MTQRSWRNLLLSLFFLATVANADTITQFTGFYSNDFFMHVTGIDSLGDSVDVNSGPIFTGGGPCPCFGNQAFDVEHDEGVFVPRTVNGVTYMGLESTFLHITGVLPPITMPVGSQGVVTFPITVDVHVIYYQLNTNPNNILFTLNGSATGTASSLLGISNSANGQPSYQNNGGFTFVSDVPEASSGWLAALGLALFGVLRRANKGMRLI